MLVVLLRARRAAKIRHFSCRLKFRTSQMVFVSTAREPQPAVSSFAATARDGGCRRAEGRAPARREAVFRLSSSLTLVAAAFARGSCAFCHHVRVCALGAIMCAWHCLQTLLLLSIGSPFSVTACALQA